MYKKTGAKKPIDSPSCLADWLNVSHELRTPANAILGHTELLLSGAIGALSAEMRTSLGNIQKAGLDLLAQIDQAIEVGQTLPFSDFTEPEVDVLTDLLIDAWTKAYMIEIAAGAARSVSCAQDRGPTHWLRILAIILHSLEAKPSSSLRPDCSSTSPSACDIDHSRTSYLVLECLSNDRADFPGCVKMIEAALVMTGGMLVQSPGEICLIWPLRTSQLDADCVMA